MSVPSAGGVHPASVGGKIQRPRRKAQRVAAAEGASGVKYRVEVSPDTGGTPAVIDAKPGAVNVVDKAKSYYHTIIIVVTAVLAFLNQVSPLGELLPEGGAKNAVTAVILFVGALLTFLKSNEIWVNRL